MNKPQVLLLGNGLNRCFDGKSWDKYLDDLAKKNNQTIKQSDEAERKPSSLPMPMKAILATNNDIKGAIANNRNYFRSKIADGEMRSTIRRLLSMRFDEILTTNYSYELEIAATQKDEISDYLLKKNMKCTCGKSESKYLLHTYQSVPYDGYENRVWHIHGESRKPDSMVLGHYWYAGLLSRYKSYLDKRGAYYQFAQKSEIAPSMNSWTDSFILGDVYVLGFGFDISEFDLWWLLNRKCCEKAKCGKLYFYEPKDENTIEKIELMALFGAESVNFGISKNELNGDYRPFYNKAMADIEEKMKNARE